MTERTLYERLGGYDAISSVVDAFLPRLASDDKLGRFWSHRGTDGVAREKQLLIDFLCSAAGGPIHYSGRAMKISHVGMKIDEDDWTRLTTHLRNTLDEMSVPDPEKQQVLDFVQSTKADIVES